MTDFEDVKKYGEKVGLSDDHESHIDSPFALIIEEVDQQKDKDLLLQVLTDSGVDLDLVSVKQQIESGHVLISHLNEAKAAIIVDKVKDIEAEIRFGLLDEIKKPSSSESTQTAFPTTVEEDDEVTDEDLSELEKPIHHQSEGLILTTAPSVEKAPVKKYLGIVSTEVSMQNTSDYDQCMQVVLEKLSKKASAAGANAVIALSFDYKSISSEHTYLIFATGTAVEI